MKQKKTGFYQKYLTKNRPKVLHLSLESRQTMNIHLILYETFKRIGKNIQKELQFN